MVSVAWACQRLRCGRQGQLRPGPPRVVGSGGVGTEQLPYLSSCEVWGLRTLNLLLRPRYPTSYCHRSDPQPCPVPKGGPRLRLVSAGMAGAHPIGAHWDAASNQRRTSHSAGQHSGSTVLGLRPPQFLSSPPPDLFHNRQEDEWCDTWVTVGSSVVYFYCYLYLS